MKMNFKRLKVAFVGSILGVILSTSFANISFAADTARASSNQASTGNRISPLGIFWNWAADKTNTDGTTITTTGGSVLQDADNWEAGLGGEYVPGKGWVPSDTYTDIADSYNTIKDTVSAATKVIITVVATPEIGKGAASVLGATAAAGAVNFGEVLADSDNGKKVSIISAVDRGTASAAITEIIGQALPGESSKLADVVAKSIIKTSVKTAADTILNGATGKDPGKSFADDLTGGLVDVYLITVGVEGADKDILKAVIGGQIKDIKDILAGKITIGGSGGTIGIDMGSLPKGTGNSQVTPGTVGAPRSSDTQTEGPSKGGTSGEGEGHSSNDNHGDGKGDDSDDTAHYVTIYDAETGQVIARWELDDEGRPITGGTPNPEEGSGTDNGLGGKLEQIGVHLPGWGKNDGDSYNGSSSSNSSSSTNSANHVGGGTNLFEPSYDTQGSIGTAAAPGSSNEGMGDGNASETGSGPGNGGGIRSHEDIGTMYSGNTADDTGFGGLDKLPMVRVN